MLEWIGEAETWFMYYLEQVTAADPEISKRGGHRSHAIHTVDSACACAHEASRAVRLGRKKGGHVPLVPYAGSATG